VSAHDAASRSVWAARYAGDLPGGSTLFVALAMAERVNGGDGFEAGTRGLAKLLGLSQTTIVRAQHELESAGIVEGARRAGSAPTRWHWKLRDPGASESPGKRTASAQAGDNPPGRVASGARPDPFVNHSTPDSESFEAFSESPAEPNHRTYVNQESERGRPCGQPDERALPEHLRDGAEPDEIPERVAALREALVARPEPGESHHRAEAGHVTLDPDW
jgi:hypothetical protein